MSLIYAALNTLEQRQAGTAVPPGPLRQPAAHAPARRLWLLALASMAVMLIGAAAVWQLQQRSAPFASVASAATAVPQPAKDSAPAAPQPVATALPAAVNPVTAVASAFGADAAGIAAQSVSAPATDQPPTPSALIAAAEPPVLAGDQPGANLVLRHPVGDARSAAAAASADSTGQLATGARRAIDAGRTGEAQALMLQLETRLAPESITLLRLRAWQALQADDAQAALALYRQITARLPDDESASLNLALAHWKLGQQEEARRIARQLIERRPESDLARRYLAQFGGGQ